MSKVRVAIIGVGNCASSFVQGVHYYRKARETDRIPGLMHVNLGGYHISDVEFSAAIDIDRNKVGKDLSEAIFTEPNNTYKFTGVPRTGIKVQRGMTHDGLGKYLSQIIQKAPGPTVDVVKLLKDTGTDVVVSYLPVGSEEATKWYVEQILEAGCGFVNCIPVFIAREPYWQRRFEKKGLPVIGDDIKSQVGATITHRVLSRLFVDRGVRIDRTYQLNFGGNTDFLNMLERERLESKKISKTNAVTSQIPYPMSEGDVHVGPSDYVPWLLDRKWCHIRMEGTTFGDVPLNLEMKLEVWDSPNSAGVVIDAVRCCKLALDNGLKGALIAPSSYFKKSPPEQFHDDVARQMVEEYIRTYGKTGKGAKSDDSMLSVRVKVAPSTGSQGAKEKASAGGRPRKKVARKKKAARKKVARKKVVRKAAGKKAVGKKVARKKAARKTVAGKTARKAAGNKTRRAAARRAS
jgi:myo-inositol-1-phosphate synthase